MNVNYHALSGKEVVEKLDSNVDGLSSGEVNKRLNKYGKNVLKRRGHFNFLKVFLNQFKSFLILILIFAGIVSFFMHSRIDAVVIFAIIILNAFLGFFQEYKAEKAIEELRKMMVSFSRVLRNGKLIEIDSKEIVPGDILILSEGDKIVGDARVLKSEGLKINEASLTGESVSVEKIVNKLGNNVSLADRINMVYQGTEVVAGSGIVIIVNTGMDSEFGKISELVQQVESEKNPFKDKLDKFAQKIGIFILILAGLIVGLLIFEGVEIFQSFLVAVSLAVSAIPEGLPAVISLGLAFATRKMIKKNVLIRKLPASETLGRVTVICTDKTGTLTEEKMKVSEVYANGKLNPSGKNSELLFKIGVLCNNARYGEKDGKNVLIGDPTEGALIEVAKDNFLKMEELVKKEVKIKEFAFTSGRKMMSVIRKSDKELFSYVKGAPEKIIEKSNYEFVEGVKVKLDDNGRKRLMKVYGGMAKRGLRVLGFAYKELASAQDLKMGEVESELIFVGFQGMIDPPRTEVKNAIKLCNDAGIKVLMITGDSKLTAEAIAEEIGLSGESVSVDELHKMNNSELLKRISKISVFSRITPEDKLRIINILKKNKEIVAMTGDGVNDALALKRADIGIAMGIRGTDVARDSSDIVLIDDNFASIVEGVKEGRTIYDNIKKFVKYLLSANFSEVVLVLIVMLIWRDPKFLPLLPLQILWINLITDSLPALALSSEKMEKDVMKRKPSGESILKGIKSFIFVAGLIAVLIGFLFFYMYKGDMDYARTMIVSSSIVFEMFLVFNCKSNGSVFNKRIFGFWKKEGIFGNKYLVYAVLFSLSLHVIAIYNGFVGGLFGFVRLGVVDWVWLVGAGFVGFLVVEGWKVWERR
jgi:P-type Ca2+ transporter type 2C